MIATKKFLTLFSLASCATLYSAHPVQDNQSISTSKSFSKEELRDILLPPEIRDNIMREMLVDNHDRCFAIIRAHKKNIVSDARFAELTLDQLKEYGDFCQVEQNEAMALTTPSKPMRLYDLVAITLSVFAFTRWLQTAANGLNHYTAPGMAAICVYASYVYQLAKSLMAPIVTDHGLNHFELNIILDILGDRIKQLSTLNLKSQE